MSASPASRGGLAGGRGTDPGAFLPIGSEHMATKRKGTRPTGRNRVIYDRCHVAWRAGLISTWYFGERAPGDPTIVWELEGVEQTAEQVHAELEARYEAAHIATVTFGRSWMGYRELVVTYADGSRLVQAWDGHAVVVREVAA